MKHLFFRNSFPGMESLCPRFNSFNDTQKLNFWIVYFAAMAQVESNCGRNEYNPRDPNGVSAGELQLQESYKKGRSWRGLLGTPSKPTPGGCNAKFSKEKAKSYTYKNPPKLYMANIENSLPCGVETLAGVLCGFYKTPTGQCKSTTKSPYGHGFWKELRVGINGKIPKIIKEFPLCKNGTQTASLNY